MRLIFLFLLCSGLSLTSAQTPAVKKFEAVRFGNTVVVDWTIFSGFECSDVQVFYGTDSNNLYPIHTEFGICGSDTADESYRFLHANPAVTKTEFYRLKVGFNEFSIILKLENELIQAFTVFPNPVNHELKIGFEAGLSAYDIIITEAAGRTVYKELDRRGQITEVDVNSWQKGVYLVSIYREGENLFNRRFVKQ